MAVEFVVRLNDDGTVTWCGLSVDGNASDAQPANPVEVVKAAFPGASVLDDPFSEAPQTPPDDPWKPTLTDLIEQAETQAELGRLWREHRTEWTAEHSKQAAQRKKEIAS